MNDNFSSKMQKKIYIIAEAGVNHNGDVHIALELCDAAKKAGADVIKFQTWKTDKIVTKSSKQAEYQKKNTGIDESQYDMLKHLELPYSDFKTIKQHCDSIGIQFASTADEIESLEFLTRLGIPFIKIGSGEICNVPYLRYAGSMNLPIILSTGMSTIEDVNFSLECLKQGGAKKITLLHCTTSYPCPYDQVNLLAMITLADNFHLPVGYSDHTIGDEIPVSAAALGASIIEKHFTLNRNMCGPDHKASMEPDDFASMVRKIRHIEKALGTGIKTIAESERSNLEIVRKSIVANIPIKKGTVIEENMISGKRVGSGISVSHWDEIVGIRAKKDYDIDDLISL